MGAGWRFIGVALVSLWGAVAVAGTTARGEVLYVLAEQAYVSIGAADGVRLGTEIEVLAGGRVIAVLEVVEVAPHTAAARFASRSRAPRVGDRVRAPVESPPAAAAERPPLTAPSPVDSGAWQAVGSTGFAKVHYEGQARPLPALRSLRSSAHLKAMGWVYLDAARGGTVQRNQLDLAIVGPLDAAGRFVIDADLTATGQAVGEELGRYRDQRAAWVDVYRAALWFRGVEGLGLGLGRLPMQGLRYGLIDGAFADYRFGEGPTVKIAAGLRPDTLSLAPAAQRPIATVGLSGDVFASWGLATYGAAVSWLGRDRARTEGAEASVDLGIDLARRVWLGLDAGGVLVLPAGAAGRFVLDRVGAATTVRLGTATTLRLAARRLEEVGLGSELQLLPVGYLPAGVTWDSLAAIDSSVGRFGPVVIDLSLAGGGVSELTGAHDMAWASPALVLRLPEVRQLRARLAYRLEYGWVTGHLGELAIGLRPLDDLTVDLMHQGGVLLTNDRHELMIVQSTWASLGYHFLERFSVSLRGRGLYGEAGRGLETMLFVGGSDLL